ncbi:hypothetical protein B0H13DRAFT_2107668 [Mycena leptocephala]|nr:hypothetical protein B0H13DRAFT_2107668 [Mycena leptocephala]
MASNSEMVMTTQGTSHLLQKAAGFDIVGGQFVLGDVHNHPGPGLVHPNTSISLVTTLNEAFSESEIYCSSLLRQKRGFPLYVPGPLINLPAPYQVHGVAIGDVGRVTAEGMFDFFFNIFLPKEHPINANHTPQDFCPMTPYESIDVCRFHYRPGNYVSTSTIQKVDLDSPSDEFPGGDFVFRCDSPEGAVLALPDGAYLQKLENLENIRTYAAKHADSWYNYINGERGRGLANGELYLVTGCEKARSWGMASYCVAHEEFQLMFKPTTRRGATYEPYRWIGPHGQKNPAKRKDHDPSTNDPLNQTTFIHGLSISLGTGLWARLFGTVTVETSSLADFQFRMNTTSASPTSSQGSLFSWSWNLLGGGSTGGNRHGVVLSVLSPIAKVPYFQNHRRVSANPS